MEEVGSVVLGARKSQLLLVSAVTCSFAGERHRSCHGAEADQDMSNYSMVASLFHGSQCANYFEILFYFFLPLFEECLCHVPSCLVGYSQSLRPMTGWCPGAATQNRIHIYVYIYIYKHPLT